MLLSSINLHCLFTDLIQVKHQSNFITRHSHLTCYIDITHAACGHRIDNLISFCRRGLRNLIALRRLLLCGGNQLKIILRHQPVEVVDSLGSWVVFTRLRKLVTTGVSRSACDWLPLSGLFRVLTGSGSEYRKAN
jgi:hypothetical protein